MTPDGQFRDIRDMSRYLLVRGAERTRLGSLLSHAARLRVPGQAHDNAIGVALRPWSDKDTAVLAHFDSQGRIDPAFAYLADALRGYGFSVLVVSTSPTRLDTLVERCEGFADAVVLRSNVGFDFGSWQRGMQFAAAHQGLGGRVILTNGSMFGPMAAIDPVLSRFADADAWGLTESLDLRRHVQSWWLGFNSTTVSSHNFRRYWSQVQWTRNKWRTILAHELTWANSLARPGTPGVQASVDDHGCSRNPLFFAWRELIADHGVPFVKRSLFGPNYDQIDMTGWQAFLTKNAPEFDRRIISSSL